jgi:predicted outer membrane repeat protein
MQDVFQKKLLLMKKKTRININTSLKIYVKVFLSFIFRLGKKNEKVFKKDIKKFLNTENILLTSQGRVAAYNIFKIILSDKKNEIIVCPYTLTEVINAIIYAGGKPIYVEINLKTGLPLEYDLNRKINKKTAGLILTHLYSNRKDILKFQKKYNKKIKIIEDVAINLGAKINHSKFLGTIFDYGFYSFGVMKNLCTFHGGAIYCKNKLKFSEIEQNLKKNINYPIISSLRLIIFCSLIDFFYNKYVYNFFTYYFLNLSINKIDKFIYPGVYPNFFKKIPNHYNFKFQSHFAIAGIENLKTLRSNNIRKIKKVKLYESYLNKFLRINHFNYYEINSFLEYPILLKKHKSKFLSKELMKIGYDIRHTWYVNSIRYLKLNFILKNFSNCEYLHEKVLCLPTHDKITEVDIIKICELINFYEK